MDKVRHIEMLCSSVQHETIIDIGCGDGSVLKRLAETGFGTDLYALEVSEIPLRVMRTKEVDRVVGGVLFDGYHIPYPDDTFDLAILSHVIEHLEYPRMMLHEAGRIARYVMIEVPLEDNIRLKADFSMGYAGHINFYSCKSIRYLIQSCDMTVLEQQIVNPSHRHLTESMGRIGLFFYVAKEMMLRLLPPLATRIFGYPCLLLCKKSENGRSQM